jgi:H+/Cl- antiporter ClcA
MGLQYFEALSPGTISSIVAVLANRLVTGNDVTGYFSYPFLTATLPSSIFTYAIVYGFYGCFVGTIYAHGAKLFKNMVHGWFHATHHHHKHQSPDHPIDDFAVANGGEESSPLVSKMAGKEVTENRSLWKYVRSYFCFVIPHKPRRAAVAGTIAGAIVGAIGIFVPHILFWGEAQLQNLIDKGRTPLPIFGSASDLTAYAYCVIDANDKDAIRSGYNIGCSSLIMFTKIVAIGLSLGTGITGGQFWGPLFVGCAASNLLTDVVELFHSHFGFGHGLAAYPCVVILCTMGAAHVGKCQVLECS